ncbi:MAG: hypothetical protein GEV11_21470 [Streptosporangiales bacterium]|nr:hypothetical protein [Streptosporangiales bacterium]
MTAWAFPEGRSGLRGRLGLASAVGTAHPETRFTARLPSSVEGLCFDASFDVVWARTGGGENANLEAMVLRHLYEVARRVTATEPVTQAEAVQARLNVVLGVPAAVDGGQVTLVRARAILTVDSASREQMRAYEEMAREASMERARRERDLERWRYLADVVFSDPALARMWWLDGHPERLPELARMDPIFDRLVEISRTDPDDYQPYDDTGEYTAGDYADEGDHAG